MREFVVPFFSAAPPSPSSVTGSNSRLSSINYEFILYKVRDLQIDRGSSANKSRDSFSVVSIHFVFYLLLLSRFQYFARVCSLACDKAALALCPVRVCLCVAVRCMMAGKSDGNKADI